jgi:RNA-binding protein
MTKRTAKEIKAIGKDLKPTIHVGKDGVDEGLIQEVELQLKTRKVVKIRLLPSASEDKKGTAQLIAEKANAELIDVRGSVVLLCEKAFMAGKGTLPELG